MARTKYVIALTEDERSKLNNIIAENRESDRTILRARILLMSDINTAEKMSIPKLAEQLGTTHTTVQTVRTEYGKYGLEAAVYRKLRTDNRKVTPEVEERIKRLLSEDPPEGHKRWTERLLCRECMDRGIIEHISLSTLHETLTRIKDAEGK